jgi:hypothetical protein
MVVVFPAAESVFLLLFTATATRTSNCIRIWMIAKGGGRSFAFDGRIDEFSTG